MLDNGLCTRPVLLECRMESACETCSYFHTGPEFVPVLLRQRDHARDHKEGCSGVSRARIWVRVYGRLAAEVGTLTAAVSDL